jgi:ABC-type polysaccharide/polyol phosphate transport system ATPase subunit
MSERNTSNNRRLPVVLIDNVSARYPREENPATSLKEFIIRYVKRDIEREYFYALKDFSLEIVQGEVLGVIGKNGAGKTTLLKLISGILRPVKGRVAVWGRIASMIGVGAGFHHELSGRENIFLYSSILGRAQSRTLELFESIVEFSELSEFIEAPIRTYSSGMIARLGFAVAMAERPDILLVDEVLGVGDTQFIQKCRMRFSELREKGTTIVIVSHSLGQIQEFCNRAVWLDRGALMYEGKPNEAVHRYRESFQ